MRKVFLCFFGMSFCLASFFLGLAKEGLGYSCLGTQASLTKFSVSVKKLELSYDGGQSFVKIFEGTQSLDMASQNAGSAIGNFFAGQQAPAGTVTHVRVTSSGSVTIKGSVTFSGTTYCTQASPTPVTTCPPAEDTSTSPTGDQVITQAVSFTIKENQTTVLQFKVDTSSALCLESVGGGNFILHPNDLTVTITQS